MTTELSNFDQDSTSISVSPSCRQATERVASERKPILKISRAGQWSYGADSESVLNKTLVACNMRALMYGKICWIDGQVRDERVVRYFSGEELPDLPDHGPYTADTDGWREQFVLPMRLLNGVGEFVYKPAGIVGRGAIAQLANIFERHVREHPAEVLVAELDSFSYRNSYGPQVGPVLRHKGWATTEQLQAGAYTGLDGTASRPPQAEPGGADHEALIDDGVPF